MLPYEKNNQRGMILVMVLIFLFVLTFISVNDSDDVIINHKMQSAMQNNFLVFMRAQSGMKQMVLAMEGITMTLPDSSIQLKTNATVVKTDHCGNQTIAITSIAKNSFSKVVLNSIDIFAKVPKKRKCKKIPAHQVLWWKQNL